MVKYSDEIDVYTVPHQRMKNALTMFVEQISLTDFGDLIDFKALLKLLNRAFTEFEIHEKIENECIIKELELKLEKLSISNVKVCECHRDSKLKEMQSLFKDGINISSQYNLSKLSDFGYKLKDALTDFTQTFIPHMEEEEEVFQPLLMQYFTYDELINLKQTVMARHAEASKIAGGFGLFYGLTTKPPYSDLVIRFPMTPFVEKSTESEGIPSTHYLPPELYMKIFCRLGPKDLLRCAQVNHHWRSLARREELWKSMSPIKWIKTDLWNFNLYPIQIDNADDDAQLDVIPDHSSIYDDGSRSDTEKGLLEFKNGRRIFKYNEAKVLIGIIKYLMPDVGIGIRALDLSKSSKLNNFFLRKILSYCPRLEYLDVSYTNISDSAFQDWHVNEGFCSTLKHVDLSGCSQITDTTLVYLSEGLTRREYSSTQITEFHSPLKDNLNYSCLTDDPRSDTKCGSWQEGLGCHSLCQKNNHCNGEFINTSSKLKIFSRCQRRQSCEDELLINTVKFIKKLQWLSLSGCHSISDWGLRFLTYGSFLPDLTYVDLSGMPHVTKVGLETLLNHSQSLVPENIFYCDNIEVGKSSALNSLSNGCQNLQCSTRYCCRLGE